MSKYDIGIIDGSYIIRRNMAAQSSYGKLDENLLLKSCIQSLMKEKRELDFDKCLIVWDRAPYFRQQEGIEEYKSDRHYVSYDDIEKLREELLWEDDPKRRAEIESQISEYEVKAWNNSISGKVKYVIIQELGKFGFYSLIKTGFEGDDLAFLIADKCPDLGVKAILLTSDHDWISYRNKNVQYTTPARRGVRNNRFDDVRRMLDLSNRTGVPLYESGILSELYKNSHNNVEKYDFCDMVPLEEFISKLYKADSSLPGFEKYYKRYQAFNIRKHQPEAEKLINFSLTRTDLASPQEWLEFLNKRSINISFATYEKFRRNCNRNVLAGSVQV